MALTPTQTPRMTALQNLQKQLPAASQKISQGIQTARDIQLQQAAAKAPTGGAIAPTAQQTAGAATTQTGTQQVETAKQMVQQAGQVGQLQLGEQQLAAQQQIAQQQQAARQQEMNIAERFAKLDLAAKQELYDAETRFKKDDAGRTLFNERQLADYAVQNARSEQEYRSLAQKAEMLNKRKLQAMETAFKIVEEDLKQKFYIAESQKNFAKAQQIAAIRTDLAKQRAKARAKANNSMTAWQTGGMIVGAVAGALIAGPAGYAAGASAGATIGGGLGSVAGSQQE